MLEWIPNNPPKTRVNPRHNYYFQFRRRLQSDMELLWPQFKGFLMNYPLQHFEGLEDLWRFLKKDSYLRRYLV